MTENREINANLKRTKLKHFTVHGQEWVCEWYKQRIVNINVKSTSFVGLLAPVYKMFKVSKVLYDK